VGGASRKEIAQRLGVGPKRIGRVLAAIYKEHESPLDLNEQRQLVATLVETFRVVEEAGWSAYRQAQRTADRLAALNTIRRLTASRVQILLRLGVIRQEQPASRPPGPTIAWSPEQRHHVAMALLGQRLRPLAEPTADDASRPDPPSTDKT
jgi:hypothetical protein